MYADASYWRERYASEGAREWYAGHDACWSHIAAHVNSAACVLHAGCGTSELGARLASLAGGVLDADYVREALRPVGGSRHHCVQLDLDAYPLPLRSGAFDVIVDKGTLDVFMASRSASLHAVARVLAEYYRVLAPGGVVVAIEAVRVPLLLAFVRQPEHPFVLESCVALSSAAEHADVRVLTLRKCDSRRHR